MYFDKKMVAVEKLAFNTVRDVCCALFKILCKRGRKEYHNVFSSLKQGIFSVSD